MLSGLYKNMAQFSLAQIWIFLIIINSGHSSMLNEYWCLRIIKLSIKAWNKCIYDKVKRRTLPPPFWTRTDSMEEFNKLWNLVNMVFGNENKIVFKILSYFSKAI